MAAFGTQFMPNMAMATYTNNTWSKPEIVSSSSIALHPGAHVLHYASTCFEGLKAFKHDDGSVYVFRMDRNIARMQQSSDLLHLPPFPADLLENMILSSLANVIDEIPQPPSSMYIRPTHVGTEAAIGKAASPSTSSMLYVLLSQVGAYFTGGDVALRLLIEEDTMRCAAHMGMVKSGGNYASAMGPILRAKEKYQADQVLFCPQGDVQETGAANFILIDGNEVITKSLDSSFLHGVTRDSILTIARDMGMDVQERSLSVEELLERVSHPGCEAALSGTAAVLAPVGTLIHNGKEHVIGSGQPGPTTLKLRETLNEIQWGKQEDKHGWLRKV
ncbi:branched chain amino acid aminotransferase [Aliidiomarina shirensis]|uniref:Branched-chain-amino-acid aminotransferase n=1 Tax=Aliidiomarina shirensis TaxID=1048642 RepID=A0A432WKQ4_9GAMM|nr:branched-chain amino acid aminotransferase [Aliidiomarina shirensis]RUO34354.1 branched chain amino acid aminotransferase [Aliidiomarina shirensis]